MKRLEIKRNQKFGKLRVLKEVAKIGAYRAFELKCECGNVVTVRLCSLRSRTRPTLSCGCWKRENSARVLRKMRSQCKPENQPGLRHGMAGTPTYYIWQAMKRRCLKPNDPGYKNYGGRGVKVCKRWLDSFENFLDDMGKRPTDRHEITRIDNDGNYEPGNCQWDKDSVKQSRNRRGRQNSRSRFKGVDYWILNKGRYQGWRARITFDGKLHYLGLFKREKDAARAYDAVACLHDGFVLNFPKRKPRGVDPKWQSTSH